MEVRGAHTTHDFVEVLLDASNNALSGFIPDVSGIENLSECFPQNVVVSFGFSHSSKICALRRFVGPVRQLLYGIRSRQSVRGHRAA